MIFELFWNLERGGLKEDRDVETLIGLLDVSPIHGWTRYDLDGMGNWRGYDPKRLIIDALTQRTAFVRVEGSTGNQALIAMGKRGEPPTLIIRGEGDPVRLERLLRMSLDEHLPIRRAGLCPVAAREAFQRRAIGLSPAGGVDIAAYVSLVHEDAMSVPRERLEALDGVHVEARGQHLILKLLDSPTTPVEEAVERWRDIATALSQG